MALSSLPERNPFFTGRDQVLVQLQEALSDRGRAALSGLGGMGKTQTAVEYAHRHFDEYGYTFWVTAHSREALVSNYATVAGRLKLPESTAQALNAAILEAEPLMRRALSIDEKSYGPEHPNVARDLNNLAGLLQATNRLEEAEPLMRRALAILVNLTRETDHLHPNLRTIFENYFFLLKEMSLADEQIARRLVQAGMDAGLDPQSVTKLLEQL